MSDCIIWPHCTDRHGYGKLRFEGRTVFAHRMAFFEHYGYWPNVCRHACDNPSCVNPEHLLDGSMADNTRDALERGRLVLQPRLNHDMPNKKNDPAAYKREKRRRQKAGTWVYRTKQSTEIGEGQ